MSQRFWVVSAACAGAIIAVCLLPRVQSHDESPAQVSSRATNLTGSADGSRTAPVSSREDGPSAMALVAAAATTRPAPTNNSTPATNRLTTGGRPAANSISPAPDFSDPPPAVVMENMRDTFRQYQSAFGGNPVGTNPEITSALMGDNPRKTTFVRAADGLRVNEKGELIDSWGTPFFFHQLSGTEMEIHSAGPDRVMWTADDLVVK